MESFLRELILMSKTNQLQFFLQSISVSGNFSFTALSKPSSSASTDPTSTANYYNLPGRWIQPLIQISQLTRTNGQCLIDIRPDHFSVRNAVRPRRPTEHHIVRPRKRIRLRRCKLRPRPRNVFTRPRPEVPVPVAADGFNKQQIRAAADVVHV